MSAGTPQAADIASELAAQLQRLPEPTRSLLECHRFDESRLIALASAFAAGSDAGNRVTGQVEPPSAQDIARFPVAGTAEHQRLHALGSDALARGQCALVVLAGGMATRMGGVVKALVDALPGRTFLDLRLAEQAAIQRRLGVAPPLWLMTSHATDASIRDALARHPLGANARVFSQFASLRLTPTGSLYLDQDGQPSIHSPGHGDAVEALQQSGLLAEFASQGGRAVMITNLDNLGSTLDEALLGWHLQHGLPVTSEVVDRLDADRGGLPVRVDGRLTVLEELRLPEHFDVSRVPVFNINSFLFDARALLQLKPAFTYFTVRKKVDGQEVIQFERLINEMVDFLPTRFVHVPRAGAESRFLPVKDTAELEARRGEMKAVLRARGIID
jgi:UTP--glucose-1-phosphate uridylyltransferase